MEGGGGAPNLEARAHHAANSTQGLIEELEDMALDPTMDQCCRRDLQDSLRRERIRHALQRGDRVDARQRLAAAAVCKDAAALAAAGRGGSGAGCSSSSSGTLPLGAEQQEQQEQQQQQKQWQAGDGHDADGELQRLRQQRLQQLKQQSGAGEEQRRQGFGTLNTVTEAAFMDQCVAAPAGRGLVVAHLVVQGHEPCSALDEVLEELAAQFRGTWFARCVVLRGSRLVADLQLPRGVPALLVAKHGAVLGKAHISQFGGADIWSEEVSAYLKRFKVLSTGSSSSSSSRPPATLGDGGDDSDAGGSSSDEEQEEGDWRTPCEVCGRTYPHEHIRSIYASQQPDSEGED